MASRMLTLFGEEMIPEDMKVAPRTGKVEPVDADPAGIKKESRKKEEEGILAGWHAEKQYYSIGEVAALFKVRTSHIRFWTTEFKLKVRTTSKGDRLYTPAAIAQLRSIYHLVKEQGFTIPGARLRLKEMARKPADTLDLKQALLQLRNQLISIRNQLS